VEAPAATLAHDPLHLVGERPVGADLDQPGGARDERRALRLSRWLTVGWGLVLIGIAMLARGWGSVFTTGLTIASIVYGPLVGTFLLAMLVPRANETGALAGLAASLASMIAIRLGTGLAWTWYVVTGAAIALAVGVGVSRLAPYAENAKDRPRH
jgi:Na+/proline symporter